MFKKAFKDTIPVLTGYMVLGMGFGIIMKTNGYGLWWAAAMSLFIYAGSMQYVAIGLLTGGASYLTVALSTLMVNARHLFYGISMVEKYKETGAKKPYLIFALTDEAYSLACKDFDTSVDRASQIKYWFLISLFNQIYWVSGSVLGSLLGNIIPFDTTGIDFALTALFITIFTDQWLKTKDHVPALIGLLTSVLSLLIFKKDSFLIPAMIGIMTALLLMKRLPAKNIKEVPLTSSKELGGEKHD